MLIPDWRHCCQKSLCTHAGSYLWSTILTTTFRRTQSHFGTAQPRPPVLKIWLIISVMAKLQQQRLSPESGPILRAKTLPPPQLLAEEHCTKPVVSSRHSRNMPTVLHSSHQGVINSSVRKHVHHWCTPRTARTLFVTYPLMHFSSTTRWVPILLLCRGCLEDELQKNKGICIHCVAMRANRCTLVYCAHARFSRLDDQREVVQQHNRFVEGTPAIHTSEYLYSCTLYTAIDMQFMLPAANIALTNAIPTL